MSRNFATRKLRVIYGVICG